MNRPHQGEIAPTEVTTGHLPGRVEALHEGTVEHVSVETNFDCGTEPSYTLLGLLAVACYVYIAYYGLKGSVPSLRPQ